MGWNYPSSVETNKEFFYSGEDYGVWELAPKVDSIPFGTKLWKFGMDQIYRPFYLNYMIKQESEFQNIVQIILNQWDTEVLIPCHGDIIRGKSLIRSILTKHFDR